MKNSKKYILALLGACLCLSLMACGSQNDSSNQGDKDKGSSSSIAKDAELIQLEEPKDSDTIVTMETSLGKISIKLFPEEAPLACRNFLTLAEANYYDGIIFHRVIDGFMIQGGDPTGTGMGGDSIYVDKNGNRISFPDEFSDKLFNFRGALSMANAGPNTNGSQFFIVQATSPTGNEKQLRDLGFPENVISTYMELGGTPHLDGHHTVFGFVIDGMDVVDEIARVETNNADKPLEDIEIISIETKNNPFLAEQPDVYNK